MPRYWFLNIGFCVLSLSSPTWGQEIPGLRMFGESSVAFAPDSKWVATGGGDGKVRIRDIPLGEQRVALVGHQKMVTAVAVSPDGQTIASSSVDYTIRLWDVTTQAERQVWPAPESEFYSDMALAYAPDGQTLAVGSAGGCLRLRDVATGTVKASWEASPKGLNVVKFAPDGRTIATTGFDRVVRLWDARTHALRFELAPLGRGSVSLAFSRDGSLLAVGLQDFIMLLDAETGKERSRLTDCPAGISALAFTRDDAFLAVGTVRDLFVVSTGVVVDQNRPIVMRNSRTTIVAVAVSPDAERLAFCFLDSNDTGHASFEMMTLDFLSRASGMDEPARN